MATLAVVRVSFSRQIIPRVACSMSSQAGKSGKSGKSGKTPTPPVKSSPPKAAAAQPAAIPDNTKYQCAEYYAYNEMSFYDIDKAMSPMRIEQPSKYSPAK